MTKRFDNCRVLVLSDTHAPYHHKGTLDFLSAVNAEYNPDRVVHAGDCGDIYSISEYPKDLEHRDTWSDEIKGLRKFVKELGSLFPRVDLLESNHDCFDRETEILTRSGFIPFESLKNGVEVGTLNLSTNEIEYQFPTKVTRDFYSGDMVRINGATSIDLLVTPNHRLYASRQTRGHFRMQTAEELLNSKCNKLFTKDAGVNNKPEYDIDDETLKLVGWYLTDASFRGNTIVFLQRKSNYKKITDLLDCKGIPYKLYEKDSSRITHICGKELKKVPENQMVISIKASEINYLVPNRYKLPDWLYNLSKRQVDILLSVLIDADGSTYTQNRKALVLYGTYDFVDQVQRLLLHSGYRATIRCYRGKDWKLNITERVESCSYKFKNHINTQEYTGPIYCATVPNDTLIVRRNGKISITGNSRPYRKSVVAGIPREFLVKYLDVIGAPPDWKIHSSLNITVDADRSNWTMVHSFGGSNALNVAKHKATNIIMGHHHSRSGIASFNNGKKVVHGIDTGCLISDSGSPYRYNRLDIGRPIRSVVMIIEGVPQIIPMR